MNFEKDRQTSLPYASWNEPSASSVVGCWPAMQTTALFASPAAQSPVTALVRPQPAVTLQTPGVPVVRAHASAAYAQVCSWRMWMSCTPCSRSVARIGQIWPPLTVKRYFTPCACRTRLTTVPPSTPVGAAPAIASAAFFPITTLLRVSPDFCSFAIVCAPRCRSYVPACRSRSTRCRILPVAVRGISSSVTNDADRGRL